MADDVPVPTPPPATGDASPARLTRTETRLLDALRGEPGRAFTRRELIQRVMPRSLVLERTIDVHIKSLRRKLGADGNLIQTVRKVGYRFAPPAEQGGVP